MINFLNTQLSISKFFPPLTTRHVVDCVFFVEGWGNCSSSSYPATQTMLPVATCMPTTRPSKDLPWLLRGAEYLHVATYNMPESQKTRLASTIYHAGLSSKMRPRYLPHLHVISPIAHQHKGPRKNLRIQVQSACCFKVFVAC